MRTLFGKNTIIGAKLNCKGSFTTSGTKGCVKQNATVKNLNFKMENQ